jgi:hypothetical protein
MTDGNLDFFHRYRRKGLLLDSNLLLLLIIGAYDPDQIKKFKRTNAFTAEDYRLLADIVRSFKKKITTPSILTEVSNLLGSLPQNLLIMHYRRFGHLMELMEEQYSPSKELAKSEPFVRFGLTDTSIIQCVVGKYLVLTIDQELVVHLKRNGAAAINFNHIRRMTWFS